MKKFLKSSLLVGILATAPGASVYAQSDAKTVDTTRDARAHGPTADNQKNNEADRKMTANIRKAVYGDKSLSMLAHNVKIITRNGDVTLRGRVKSEDEKKAVVAKAQEVAGAGKVTDEIRVSAANTKEKQPDK